MSLTELLSKVQATDEKLKRYLYIDLHPNFDSIKKQIDGISFSGKELYGHHMFRYRNIEKMTVYDHLEYFKLLVEKYLDVEVNIVNIIDLFMDANIKNQLIRKLGKDSYWDAIRYLFRFGADSIDDDYDMLNGIMYNFLTAKRDHYLLTYILDHCKFRYEFHYTTMCKLISKIHSPHNRDFYRGAVYLYNNDTNMLSDLIYIKQVKQYLSYTIYKLLLIRQLLPSESTETDDNYGQVKDIFSYIRKLYLGCMICY